MEKAVKIPQNKFLGFFSKLTCASTLFLIFAGSLVTSTGSGLAVPDWPLSYGSLFPPMVGGVFYEHGHRMVASTVGLFTLILAFSLWKYEERTWVKNLGWVSLGAVIFQGILGGITVKFFLPTPVSVFHGVLAQTFLVLTIIIAYSQSNERHNRINESPGNPCLLKLSLLFILIVYLQLIIAAVMRHTHSGLAIPDFPTMGRYFWPPFNEQMLKNINNWRFDADLEPVALWQVMLHFVHRLGGIIILIFSVILTIRCLKEITDKKIREAVILLMGMVLIQISLGILTIWTHKAPYITSLHVVNGAAVLGISVLLLLRILPLRLKNIKEAL